MYLCGDYSMYCIIAFSLFVPLFEVMQPIFKCSGVLLHVSSFLSVLLLILIHTINLQATYLHAIWQFSTSHHLVVVDMWQIIMASFISGYLIRLLFYALWWLMVIDGVNCNTWLLNQSPPVTSKINTLVRTPLTESLLHPVLWTWPCYQPYLHRVSVTSSLSLARTHARTHAYNV